MVFVVVGVQEEVDPAHPRRLHRRPKPSAVSVLAAVPLSISRVFPEGATTRVALAWSTSMW
jgi:hypothetical protein